VSHHLNSAIKALGGINLIPLLQLALEMGDEAHNRPFALTNLLVSELTLGLLEANIPRDTMSTILKWFAPSNWKKNLAGAYSCLGLTMAVAKAILDTAKGIEYCTLVTCMCRNGTDFGIRIGATGEEWHVAPSPVAQGKFFSPYTQNDAGGDMGDSAITECNGWGCFILSNSPALLKDLPADVGRAKEITEHNSQMVIGANPLFPVPALNFKGSPAGIDIRKVISLNISPWIDTAIAHKEKGHRIIGVGFSKPPMECFSTALKRFAEKYGVEPGELLE